MIENPKISVIVTVHNSEKYLEKCLQSVCAQTFQDIEILCIDGKSNDNSPQILLNYKEKDDRIRIINDENSSYGHKINVGIERALGEYISILESDDQYASTMLETLYKIIDKYQLDYIDSDFFQFCEVDGKIFRFKKSKYKNKDIYNRIINASQNNKIISTGAIWTGLYNRAFLINQKIKLNESAGASFQDTSFGFQVGVFAKRSYHLSKSLYYYRIDNVGSSVKDNEKIFEIAYEVEYLKNCLEKGILSNQKVWELYYRTKYNVFFWNACRLSDFSREKFLHLYVNNLKKDIINGNIKKNSITMDNYRVTYLALENYQKFKKILSESYRNINYSENIYNMITLIGKKDIVIFGAGIRGEQLIDLYSNQAEQIKCLCDNSEELQGKKIDKYHVLSVPDAVKKYPKAIFIIANLWHSKEMKYQLIDLGISNKKIYIFKHVL